ncbi:MAG: bifunctional D-glycero-beta-D-manno-heptose-7-phosphate kinase/D-glycero-beta-D-manno-heptose 1-phosphate adenylyltransferase HldE [Pseudomonadota bacterium]|nr:bifunctional D-glycero-beta-D-manno-heptose-7-phosphate kinase/D-glycero-beta-D-manno-heptose 1-phosphate adenylyltransferase HldE [Pseudomonadota bacterium]
MTIKIPDFAKVRALVVGDVMLDRYWQGSTGRISPEAPVPVVRVDECHERAGGAGNVALNLAALGVQTRLLGVTGQDEAAERLTEVLTSAGVRCDFQRMSGMPTITKLRVLSRHQQLIRLDFERPDGELATGRLDQAFEQALADCDVVIFSDYGKGTLQAVQAMIQAARARQIPVFVDPKGTDFDRYRGASALTPNLGEFTAVAGSVRDEAHLIRAAAQMCRTLELERLLVTRSEDGMSLFDAKTQPIHLPARAREVYDVTGAGDTVISLLAAGRAAGLEWADAAGLANLAAGLVVGKLGAATVTVAELQQSARPCQVEERGVVDEERLLALVAAARARGETVAMTNGCFDILHRGHVTYLKQARQLADRLIIAVNDDDSVRRLKGSERPLNSVDDRMTLLAALSCVDWVVPFSEDTPARLISRVLPQVLVKGGDYSVEEIAGATTVMENGGQVKILPFEDGYSTSSLIERVRKS